MPLYEYRCHKCGKTFETLQKFSDRPIEVHEDCGGEVERLISPSALHFKGHGWYVTDYARNGKSPSTNGGGNGKSESKSDGKSEGKSESSKSESSKSESKPAPSTSSSEK